MKHAAVYARFSSSNQREESIDAQLRAIREYAEKQNMKIVATYIDEARSATTDNRPEFRNMIEQSSYKEFNYVIVHKLDRFARNVYDSVYYKHALQTNNVKLLSVIENLDDSPESGLLESVLIGLNEYYSKNLAREAMKGMKENALKGLWCGGTPPLGYDVVEKRLIINPAEAECVKVIFSMYVGGYGYKLICRTLNEKGYTTKTGKQFSSNSIYGILRNEKYIGNYVFNKRSSKNAGTRNNHKYKDETEHIKIEGGCPDIIEKDIWNKVHEKLENRKNGSQEPRMGGKRMYYLTGKMSCGLCDSAYHGAGYRSGRNGKKYYIYSCHKYDDKKQCKNMPIRKDKIEEHVFQMIKEHILSPDVYENLITQIVDTASTKNINLNNKLKELKKRQIKVNSQLEALVDAYLDGTLDNDIIKARQTKLKDERDIISEQLFELEGMENIVDTDKTKHYLKVWSEKIGKEMTDNEKKSLIGTFVEKILVNPDEFDVKLCIPESFISFNDDAERVKVGGGGGS